MARKPQVTRTMRTTSVNVLCVNPTTRQTYEKTVELAGVYKDEKKLKKALDAVDTETEKIVSVLGTTIQEQLYGMSEADFLANAQPLAPRS